MGVITLSLTDRQMRMLRKRAARFGMKPEELLLASAEQLAAGVSSRRKPPLGRRMSVSEAVDYVIAKNDELLRRLA